MSLGVFALAFVHRPDVVVGRRNCWSPSASASPREGRVQARPCQRRFPSIHCLNEEFAHARDDRA